jgi:hypothetical protein
MNISGNLTLISFAACALVAQPVSSYRYSVKGDEKTVEITNVHYEIAGRGDLLLAIRETTHSKQVLGDIGMEASTTTEAWKLGTDLKQKPLYSVTIEGSDSRVVEDDVFVVSRGLEEVEWWSVYRLTNGAHLFDTYVPLVKLGEAGEFRYAGLEVAADDVKDVRLKEAHVIGVLSYASREKIIREALITCDDPKQAQLLRSFADETRTLTASGGKSASLRLSFRPNIPSSGTTLSISIPIAADTLDLAHAQLPPHLHVTVWKR